MTSGSQTELVGGDGASGILADPTHNIWAWSRISYWG